MAEQNNNPNISYNVDWRYNSERKTDGSMYVDIYCSNENNVFPEDLSKKVIEALSEMFLTDKGGTYCLLWNKSNSFDIETKEPLVSGITIFFDVIAFPEQETDTPCPIWSVNQFIKKNYPDCLLIGHDKIKEKLRATAEKPIVYVRKVGTKNIKTSYAMALLETNISISIISDNVHNTRKLVSSIVNSFNIEMETIMQNGSPFLIINIKESTENDVLKTGQIAVSGQYGIMRKEKEETPMNNLTFNKR